MLSEHEELSLNWECIYALQTCHYKPVVLSDNLVGTCWPAGVLWKAEVLRDLDRITVVFQHKLFHPVAGCLLLPYHSAVQKRTLGKVTEHPKLGDTPHKETIARSRNEEEPMIWSQSLRTESLEI